MQPPPQSPPPQDPPYKMSFLKKLIDTGPIIDTRRSAQGGDFRSLSALSSLSQRPLPQPIPTTLNPTAKPLLYLSLGGDIHVFNASNCFL